MARQRRGASASESSGSGAARPDRRFKNPDHAPPIVSEKRLTFFLPEDTFRALRFQTGYFQVSNAQADDGTEQLPETPSALVREAINYWLDQFRPETERSRTDREWKQRVASLRSAIERFSGTPGASADATGARNGGKRR